MSYELGSSTAVAKGMVVAIGLIAASGTTASADTKNNLERNKRPDPQIQLISGLGGISLTAFVNEKHKHHSHKHSSTPLNPLLRRIGGCETNNSPTAPIDYSAQNPTSTASGGFQIIIPTWDKYMGYTQAKFAPPIVQDKKAEELLKDDGTSPWVSSEYCWGY